MLRPEPNDNGGRPSRVPLEKLPDRLGDVLPAGTPLWDALNARDYTHVSATNRTGGTAFDLDHNAAGDSLAALPGADLLFGGALNGSVLLSFGAPVRVALLEDIDLDALTAADVSAAHFLPVPGGTDPLTTVDVDGNDTLLVLTDTGKIFAVGNFDPSSTASLGFTGFDYVSLDALGIGYPL